MTKKYKDKITGEEVEIVLSLDLDGNKVGFVLRQVEVENRNMSINGYDSKLKTLLKKYEPIHD